jgi:hypothetical protein
MLDMKYVATVLFLGAVIHTFCTKRILKLAHRYPEGSMQENFLHFLGEIEVVFGLWAALFVATWSFQFGITSAAEYLQSINYTEPVFVFVIMCMAATRPILYFAEKTIALASSLIPLARPMALYISCLILGPLLGSVITEPAAMTVTAILLRDQFFRQNTSMRFKYVTLGLLFVNISIGGTLTNFAAPPVLMVAAPWQWDSAFMLTQFGWRAALAIVIGTVATGFYFRKELLQISTAGVDSQDFRMKNWVIVVHLGFLALTILNAHHMAFFVPLFLLFLGWCTVAKEYQDELRLKESLLVGFFLGGLVTLGKLQDWWLQPILSQLGEMPLFWGALSLTAVTDNAALTYLGTLVPDLTASARYALVAGAVAGGGLTVIANAPNPAGYGLLRDSFGEDGISPLGLLLSALPFTLLAAGAFLI